MRRAAAAYIEVREGWKRSGGRSPGEHGLASIAVKAQAGTRGHVGMGSCPSQLIRGAAAAVAVCLPSAREVNGGDETWIWPRVAWDWCHGEHMMLVLLADRSLRGWVRGGL